MHLLKQLFLLLALVCGIQALAMPAELPAEQLLDLNTTSLELAKRQDVRWAGDLFTFARQGCNTGSGYQSYGLWLGTGCNAVTNAQSVSWTVRASG